MEYTLPFLIVDKDQIVTTTLRQLISKLFPNSTIYSAKDGEKAWEFVVKPPKKPIIISADPLPKLSGYQLLRKLREEDEYKDTYFIAITGIRQTEDNKKALQRGADDYISMPFTIEKVISKLKAATSIVEMRNKLAYTDSIIEDMKDKLEYDVQASMNIIYEFQQRKMPDTAESLEVIEKGSQFVARNIGDYTQKSMDELRYAAKLCFVGKLCLNEKLLNAPVMNRGFVSGSAMEETPVFARDIVSNIRGFEEVANILYHIYENFDGSGIPEKVKNWQIPLSSRILRVVMDFEEYFKQNHEHEGKALDILYLENKRLYDYKVVALFEQFLASGEYFRSAGIDIPMEFDELDEGMVLSRNIVTESGLLVLSAGMVLTDENLRKINEIRQSDPIIGNLFVRAKKKL